MAHEAMVSKRRTAILLFHDASSAEVLGGCLTAAQAVAVSASSVDEVLTVLGARPVDLVIAALEADAMRLLSLVQEHHPAVPVVIATPQQALPRAIEALKAGAADYLLLPLVAEQVDYVLTKTLAARCSEDLSFRASNMLGEAKVMEEVWSVLRRAAAGEATVLIRGESGTGKELVARAIHDQSPRAERPFVKIDCASLPEALLESELFGYEKGAFTGAIMRKPGRVELADRGTLFFDEVGELGTSVQAKLLRLLQDRQLERLGGTKTIAVDVRVIAATHRDLETMIDRGQFRQDLFYRLNVVPLWLPPLRARRADIDLLARHFVSTFGAANGKPSIAIDDAALKVLRGQRWPGNVRQLQNAVERLVVLSESPVITADAVHAELSQRVRFVTEPHTNASADDAAEPRPASMVGPLAADMREAERRALARALKHAGGNRTLAARLLGVSRSTLYEKLAEHGLV